MDHIYIEKLQAMKAKKKFNKKNQFLNNLILYFLTTMSCFLFCVVSFWLPSLYSSMNVHLSISFPSLCSSFFSPKFLFIVCNVIVVFLVGESKIFGSKSSPATEVYDECLKRSKSSLSSEPTLEVKKTVSIQELKLGFQFMEESSVEGSEVIREEHGEEEEEEERQNGRIEEEINEREKEEEEEDEYFDVMGDQYHYNLPKSVEDEELNRRVENFIARVRRQRELEIGLLVCST